MPTLPTLNDLQPVNPILTNMLVAYTQKDARFVARDIFPAVPVEKDSGTFFIFTKDYWMRNEMLKRAPGGDYPKAGFALSTDTYTTVQYALGHDIPDEIRANSQLPLDLENVAARWLAQQSLMRKEINFAAVVFTTSVWTTQDNDAATDWDDFSSGDPVSNILGGKSAISLLTGCLPNKLVVGELVDDALVNHPDMLDRIKYVSIGGVENMRSAMMQVLGIEQYLVARGTYNASQQGQDFSGTRIIDDDAFLCYVGPSVGVMDASVGKCFTWAPGGGDGGVRSIYDDKNDTTILKLKQQNIDKVTGADLGAIWLGIV